MTPNRLSVKTDPLAYNRVPFERLKMIPSKQKAKPSNKPVRKRLPRKPINPAVMAGTSSGGFGSMENSGKPFGK